MVIDSKHTSVSGETSHSSEEPGIVGSNLTLEEGWLDEASAILLDVEGRDALDQVNDLAKLAQDQQASSVTVSIFDQIDVDFGRTFAALAERDIDFLLLEEFQVNPDFVRWFCNEIGLSGIEPGGAWHSVFDADGETDLLLRVYENHDKIGILIENKVAASEQPDQGKRYYVRGKRMVNQGKLTSFKTVICAPEVYLNGHDTKHYDHYISYEKIMIWFARQSDQRAQWRCHVVRQAIDQSRRG